MPTPNKIVILTNDQNGEPVDLEKKVPALTGRVVLNNGVPLMGTPEFDKYLEAWHRKNNPHLFVNEEE